MTTKTAAEMTAIIVASTIDEATKSNLIAGSGYAWNEALRPFGLTTDDQAASEVIGSVQAILCRQRGVELTF